MIDYLNYVKNAGMGAFWEGQNQQDKLNSSAVQQMLQQAQTEASRGAEARNQAMHPLEMEAKKASTDLTRGQIASGQFKMDRDKEEAMRKSAENFFKYLTSQPDDVEGAVLYSGVPRQFADRWRQLDPQARDLALQEMEKRAARGSIWTAGEKKRAEAEAGWETKKKEIEALGNNQMRVQQATTDRALQLQRMREDAAAAVRNRLQNTPKKPMDALLFEEIDLTKKILATPPGPQQDQLREQLSVVRALIDNARAGAQQERTPMQTGVPGMAPPGATPVQRQPVPGVDTGTPQGGRVINFGDLK